LSTVFGDEGAATAWTMIADGWTSGWCGWLAAVVIPSWAVAVRLARFNVGGDFRASPGFFRGMPAPMVATTLLAPVAMAVRFPTVQLTGAFFFWYPLSVAYLAVSSWPTFSSKRPYRALLAAASPAVRFALGAFVVALAAGLWYDVWGVLLALQFIYMTSIPVSGFVYQLGH
jgi:phosphatidylserine synthase